MRPGGRLSTAGRLSAVGLEPVLCVPVEAERDHVGEPLVAERRLRPIQLLLEVAAHRGEPLAERNPLRPLPRAGLVDHAVEECQSQECRAQPYLVAEPGAEGAGQDRHVPEAGDDGAGKEEHQGTWDQEPKDAPGAAVDPGTPGRRHRRGDAVQDQQRKQDAEEARETALGRRRRGRPEQVHAPDECDERRQPERQPLAALGGSDQLFRPRLQRGLDEARRVETLRLVVTFHVAGARLRAAAEEEAVHQGPFVAAERAAVHLELQVQLLLAVHARLQLAFAGEPRDRRRYFVGPDAAVPDRPDQLGGMEQEVLLEPAPLRDGLRRERCEAAAAPLARQEQDDEQERHACERQQQAGLARRRPLQRGPPAPLHSSSVRTT